MRSRGLYHWLLVAVLGFAVVGSTLALSRRGLDYTFFDPIIDVKAIVSDRFVRAPDDPEMQQGAIRGMLEALNDPYTFYVPPADQEQFQRELTGEYVGIGVAVDSRDGWLTVITPLDGSPAIKAGIIADDRIVEVEGVSTAGKTPDECVELLKGPEGTPVNIVIERNGRRIPKTVNRERIVARTIRGFHREGGDGPWLHMIDPDRRIAFIRITQFTPSTDEEFKEVVRELREAGELGGLVLDVRGNPGGVMTSATRIADMFLDSGTIVSVRGRATTEDSVRASRPGTLPDFPLAVLIDGQSASGAEILAGALADHDRAIAVGTRSFGKASVQEVIPLPSGKGELKLTVRQYYLPSGRSPQREDGSPQWGVDPSPGFHVSMTEEELADVMRLRREEEIIRAAEDNGRWGDTDWVLEHLRDKVLDAGVRAVQQRVDSGQWVPTGGEAPAASELAVAELSRAQQTRQRILRELSRIDRRIESLSVLGGEPLDAPDTQLWPEDARTQGGRLEVFDAEGNRIATLRVTGEDLHRWLMDAGVEPAQ